MARTKTTARKSMGGSTAAKAKVAKKSATTSPGKAPRKELNKVRYATLRNAVFWCTAREPMSPREGGGGGF